MIVGPAGENPGRAWSERHWPGPLVRFSLAIVAGEGESATHNRKALEKMVSRNQARLPNGSDSGDGSVTLKDWVLMVMV